MAKQIVPTGMNTVGVKTPAFPRKTIFVSVTKSIQGTAQEKRDLGITTNTPLVDCARGFWLVNPAKASQCELIAAVCRDQIIGVWQIDRSIGWRRATRNAILSRNLTTVDTRRWYCEALKEILPENGLYPRCPINNVQGLVSMYRRAFRYNF